MVNALVKSPDAALRFILSHCGVRKVRRTPSDLRALPANFLRARPENSHFLTFYEFTMVAGAGSCVSACNVHGLYDLSPDRPLSGLECRQRLLRCTESLSALPDLSIIIRTSSAAGNAGAIYASQSGVSRFGDIFSLIFGTCFSIVCSLGPPACQVVFKKNPAIRGSAGGDPIAPDLINCPRL